MRTVVTGAGNPFGEAIVAALLREGHNVRIFGVGPDVAARFPEAQWHPGSLTTPGSIEPVLSERQVLVHAACLDEPGDDRQGHAVHIERGTLYTRYGAEREQVDFFIHVAGPRQGRFAKAQEQAADTARGTRGTITTKLLAASDPEATARDVLDVLATQEPLGKQPGRENDAVTL